ncbi:MAG: TetR/AcrR family transcriptional regulator [Hyphomicrobiaceae bacterium]
MPKLKPETQAARRAHILDCAERCFARAGFHRTTMAHICAEAGISAGALYVYFDSKEALIEGLCERDRAAFSERFQALAAAPDTLAALAALGRHYFVEEPPHKQRLSVEIGVEATRNPRVGEIFRGVDGYCGQSFRALFERLAAEGRIAPTVDIETLSKVFMVIGDGMFWRRAVDPGFDAQALLPAIVDVIGHLLDPHKSCPVPAPPPEPAEEIA